jgi:hypothetical protein
MALRTYGYLHQRKTLVVDRPLSRTEKGVLMEHAQPPLDTLGANNFAQRPEQKHCLIHRYCATCMFFDSQQGLLVVVAEFPPQHGSRFLMVRMLPYRSHGSPPVPFLGTEPTTICDR